MNVSEIQTFEHDVLVIGAGGAGLRAAIECSARGMNTGVISKSLLGKAHTVMAEGGMAASLGNVDVEAGNRILFGKYSGTDITIDGDEQLILREDEVLAIIED